MKKNNKIRKTFLLSSEDIEILEVIRHKNYLGAKDNNTYSQILSHALHETYGEEVNDGDASLIHNLSKELEESEEDKRFFEGLAHTIKSQPKAGTHRRKK
jgi:hypothetical protein